jgi:hypothetical protein
MINSDQKSTFIHCELILLAILGDFGMMLTGGFLLFYWGFPIVVG